MASTYNSKIRVNGMFCLLNCTKHCGDLEGDTATVLGSGGAGVKDTGWKWHWGQAPKSKCSA